MKIRIAGMLLTAFLIVPAAYADTVWGTVARSSSGGIDLNVLGQDGQYYPNTLPVRIERDTRFLGVRSALELSPGDMVRAEIQQSRNGVWEATNVEKAPGGPRPPAASSYSTSASSQQYGTEYAPAPYAAAPRPSNALLDSLKSPQAQKMLKEGLSGAVVGGIAASASGGKLGKGALFGAGAGVAAGLLTDYLQNRPPAAPAQNFGPARRVVRRYDEAGNVIGEEVFTR